MFNLARRKELPPNLKQEEMVFLSKPENQKLQEDANGIATTMVRKGLERPEDALAVNMGVEYWQYIKGYRPKYLRKVLELADKMADALELDFRNNPQKYPLPAPQGQSQMASTEKQTVESSILPNGVILVRAGRKCSMRTGGRTVTFEADSESAICTALSKISRESV